MIQLNISDTQQLENAFIRISQNVVKHLAQKGAHRFLLQKMYPPGVELILGTSKDPLFGSVIMFGVGGIFVELYQDIVFKILPVTRQDAQDMIPEIKAGKLLDGFRGLPEVDKSLLSDLIYSFGKMIQENPQIIEMDINPLIWPKGSDHPVVVDCRATVSD